MGNYYRFANGGGKISIKSFFVEILFFSVHSAVVKYQEDTSPRISLPTVACWVSRAKSEVNCRFVLTDLGTTCTKKSFSVNCSTAKADFDCFANLCPLR